MVLSTERSPGPVAILLDAQEEGEVTVAAVSGGARRSGPSESIRRGMGHQQHVPLRVRAKGNFRFRTAQKVRLRLEYRRFSTCRPGSAVAAPIVGRRSGALRWGEFTARERRRAGQSRCTVWMVAVAAHQGGASRQIAQMEAAIAAVLWLQRDGAGRAGPRGRGRWSPTAGAVRWAPWVAGGPLGSGVSTEWTIHGEKLVDENRHIRLSTVDVTLPDGVSFTQYVAKMPPAAMTLVVNDDRQVLLMRRHRFIIDRWVWELPGGYVDGAEDLEAAAAREVEEGTGWRPHTIEHLVTFQPAIGSVDQPQLIYLAPGTDATDTSPDINEAQEVRWWPIEEAVGMIAQAEIVGTSTIVALYRALTLA